MPERKGRKRREARERRRASETQAATATIDAPPAPPTAARTSRTAASGGPLPSMTARVTGLMIVVLTAFLAVLMVYQSLTGDASGIDVVARIIGGSLLIVLAIVVGVLSLVPGMVRDWFARRR